MEHSHYQAKAVYFKKTRHGGGKVKSNAMHEMFNWFYRVSAGRARRKTRVKNALRCKITKVINVRRSEAYHASCAKERLQQWVATKRRCGSSWS